MNQTQDRWKGQHLQRALGFMHESTRLEVAEAAAVLITIALNYKEQGKANTAQLLAELAAWMGEEGPKRAMPSHPTGKVF